MGGGPGDRRGVGRGPAVRRRVPRRPAGAGRGGAGRAAGRRRVDRAGPESVAAVGGGHWNVVPRGRIRNFATRRGDARGFARETASGGRGGGSGDEFRVPRRGAGVRRGGARPARRRGGARRAPPPGAVGVDRRGGVRAAGRGPVRRRVVVGAAAAAGRGAGDGRFVARTARPAPRRPRLPHAGRAARDARVNHRRGGRRASTGDPAAGGVAGVDRRGAVRRAGPRAGPRPPGGRGGEPVRPGGAHAPVLPPAFALAAGPAPAGTGARRRRGRRGRHRRTRNLPEVAGHAGPADRRPWPLLARACLSARPSHVPEENRDAALPHPAAGTVPAAHPHTGRRRGAGVRRARRRVPPGPATARLADGPTADDDGHRTRRETASGLAERGEPAGRAGVRAGGRAVRRHAERREAAGRPAVRPGRADAARGGRGGRATSGAVRVRDRRGGVDGPVRPAGRAEHPHDVRHPRPRAAGLGTDVGHRRSADPAQARRPYGSRRAHG